MSKLDELQNTDVVELAPSDLDEGQVIGGSKWTAASKAVTAVAGSIALASGVLVGNSFGIPGVIPAGALLNTNSTDAAFASDSAVLGENQSGTGANGSGTLSAGNAFGQANFRRVQLSSGAVVTLPTSEPVPAGATVLVEQVTAGTNTGTNLVTTPSVILPALPTFDAGNTSSATPGGGTVANPGTGSGSGNTSSATPAGGSGGSGSYDDDDDDEHEDHDDHEDHEDEDDD